MLLDGYGRKIDYLRISITDRCNLRCTYCMPPEGIEPKGRQEMLRYEEIERLVQEFVRLGVTRIRITGGEPLVRRGVVDLIGALSRIEGIEDLSLTTNGTLLDQYARPLKESGLGRVNISLDSFDSERFRRITRGGDLGQILRGIHAALEADLQPVKLNVVVIRGVNDDELPAFIDYSRTHPVWVRFIEFMPMGEGNLWAPQKFVSSKEVKERVGRFCALTPLEGQTGNGPAAYYQVEGGSGRVGFISSLTEHTCLRCNRLRLTCEGRLRSCLLQDQEVDLRAALREENPEDELGRQIEAAVKTKPLGHSLDLLNRPCSRGNMSAIGG